MSLQITDLENLLSAPDGNVARHRILTRLSEIERQLCIHIAQGLPRDEFLKWQAMVEAVRAAHEVLSAWAVAHPSIPAVLPTSVFSHPSR